MELLEGETLAESLHAGNLSDLARRLDIVEQLCSGLAFVHASGVIHRDVKPNNVKLLPSGTLKIVDFGVAWLEGSAATTRTSQLLGTPQYMAPEQFLGEPIDHRVDQWAVGVILWELLAGRRRFDAARVPSLIYQVVHHPLPAAPPDVPAELLAVAVKELAKRPADRFPSLEEMRAALAAARENLPTTRSLSKLRPTSLLGPQPGSTGGDVSGMPHPALATPRGGRGAFLPVGSFGEAQRVRRRQPVAATCLALGKAGRMVITGHANRALRVHNTADCRLVATLHGHRKSVGAVLARGSLVASGGRDGAVRIHDLDTRELVSMHAEHTRAVNEVVFFPVARRWRA